MTALGSVEAEDYCAAVRAALTDLPASQRDELTEDLPDHLMEVLAEGEGSLIERLGRPEQYAADLRAAAGLETADEADRPREDLLTVGRRWLRRADERLGRTVGASRLSEQLVPLAPAWWVVRGWIVAQWLANRGDWQGIVPGVGDSRNAPLGLGLVLVCVVASVWAGFRLRGAPSWARAASAVISVIVALWAIVVLAGNSQTGGSGGGYVAPPVDNGITDLYVYDQSGNLVPHARIFDQNGNPVDMGQPCYDANGNQIGVTSVNGDYSYPLCQSPVGGPAAPGPLTATPSGANPSTPSTVPPSGAAPTGATPSTPAPTGASTAPPPARSSSGR